MKEYGEFKSTFYGYWKMDRKELHKNPPRIQRVAMEYHHIIKDHLQMSHFCSYVKLPDAILWKGVGVRRKMTLFFPDILWRQNELLIILDALSTGHGFSSLFHDFHMIPLLVAAVANSVQNGTCMSFSEAMVPPNPPLHDHLPHEKKLVCIESIFQ